MALLKKSAGSKAAAKASSTVKVKLKLELATERSEPPEDLSSYSILLYGAKKIGKTSLMAQFPNPYFLATEPGVKALRVLGSHVPDWDHLVGYIDLLEAEADPTRTVIVDVVDLAYDFIYDKVCKAQMIDSPTEENDFGATWRKIKKGFREQLMRICNMPGGSVFLSHDTEKMIELRDGSEIERTQPTMGKQALGEVEGLVDIIALYRYDDDGRRILQMDGTRTLMAGCRLQERFLAPSGERLSEIPMGNSPKEAYDNLMAAFRNELEATNPAPKPTKVSGLKLRKK